MSGKKRVVSDGEMLIEKSEYSNEFSFSFGLDKSYCNIIQLGLDKMEFRIDNKSFSTISTEKTYELNDAKVSKAVENKRNSSNEVKNNKVENIK